jgi:hypothetical protein
MKYILKYIYSIVPISLLLLIGSCELEEANKNPNDVTSVPAHVLLPFNQESIASLMIGTTQVMSGIFMQYYEGIDNYPLSIQTYLVNEATYPEWNFQDYYNGPMINLIKMIEIAEAGGQRHYVGIGKTMLALCLGNVTSLWGDVPYTEALQSTDNLSPEYNDQQSLYDSIQSLLDAALIDFDAVNEGRLPGTDDVIFSGDIEKWKQTAYALKARYYMHVSKRTGELPFDPVTEALSAIENAYTSSESDLIYQFGFTSLENSPFYSYARLNYIIPNPNFTLFMFELGDPRDTLYYKIKYKKANLEERYFTSPASPVYMVNYHEMKFIEAEARLRQNTSDPLIQTALNEAVRAHMKLISSDLIHDTIIDDYISRNLTLTGVFADDLETIINQKYIASYAGIESWTDYRRTGYPDLEPNEGGDHNQNPGGGIPRRLPYPQNERLYNKNFPQPLPTMQDRFWWDQ